MATPGITWVDMILSKYVGHRKLVKLLLNKARTNNVQIGEGEFQIRVCAPIAEQVRDVLLTNLHSS